MKRLPTPEERKLWHESNKFTSRKRTPEDENLDDDAHGLSGDSGEAGDVPLPSGERLGEGLPKIPSVPHKPSSHPSPAGRGGDPAATSRAKPLPPLRRLSQREANRTFKQYPIAATLDLHGLTKLEAYARVQQFIAHQQAAGRRHVLIITGKGKSTGEAGVLRLGLPHWLNEPALRPLISAFAHARPEKGGAGVTHVLLKAR